MPEKKFNRVWIELERPKDAAHAKEICDAANRMLARLRKPEDTATQRDFWWNDYRKLYAYGGPMGYTDLVDWGEWFNLDYLGRE